MITGHTRVLALMGSPARRSRSPEIQNRWLQQAGIDAVYVVLETATVDPATVVRAGLWGANITTPLKTRCGADRLDADAAETAAVNTLYWDGAQLVGDNTDVEGFLRDAEARLGPLAGRRVAVLGAGGAARSVVAAARRAKADEVRVFARREPDFPTLWAPITGADLADFDLVVQAMPGRGRLAVEQVGLPRTGAWYDLNYWDPDPPHREALVARGQTFIDGHGMLWLQAALAFERWTGLDPSKLG
jgi:shikimate dehydrogenase